MLREFKTFAMRGNVVDMAVGIIIGGAFGTIVKSLVNDVIMPPLGVIVGGVDFSDIFITLTREGDYATLAEAQAAGAATLNIGLFINNVISFVIVAFAAFLLVRTINRIKRKEEAAPDPEQPSTRPCPYCLSVIPIKAMRCAQCTSKVKPPAE